MAIDPSLEALIRKLPKTELHLHLEGGSMYPDLALKYAERNRVPLPFHDEATAADYYRFTSLDQFIDILRTTVSTLNTAEDYCESTVRLGQLAAEQNIRHHEIFVTWGLVSDRGVAWETIVEGISEGRRINAERFGVDTWFIADIDRTKPAEHGLENVKLAHRDRGRAGIIGIGLDCQERGYPPSNHKAAFELAAEYGFHRVAHAGEDGPPAYILDALDNLKVERIDHGVRCVEDPAVVKRLVNEQIPLTVCPVSNIALCVFPEMARHSFLQMLEAGVNLTVNSDDPPMFATDVVGDMIAVVEAFDLGREAIIALCRNSIRAAFMDSGKRRAMLAELEATAAGVK